MDPLDPRFDDLLRRIGFPEAVSEREPTPPSEALLEVIEAIRKVTAEVAKTIDRAEKLASGNEELGLVEELIRLFSAAVNRYVPDVSAEEGDPRAARFAASLAGVTEDALMHPGFPGWT